MATQQDVRTIALALPGVIEEKGRFAFSIERGGKLKGIVWAWRERIDPKKPKVPNPEVVAVRVADLNEKDALLAVDPAVIFTEPHYNGYPAVLVRLPAVKKPMLRKLIGDAWQVQTAAPVKGSRKKGR